LAFIIGNITAVAVYMTFVSLQVAGLAETFVTQ